MLSYDVLHAYQTIQIRASSYFIAISRYTFRLWLTTGREYTIIATTYYHGSELSRYNNKAIHMYLLDCIVGDRIVLIYDKVVLIYY